MRIRKFSTQKTRFRGEIAQNIETWYTMGKFMPGRRISNWYYVYVLQSLKDGEFYVGYTANLAGRIAEEGISRLASAIVQEIVGAYRSGEIERGDRLHNRLKQLAAV